MSECFCVCHVDIWKKPNKAVIFCPAECPVPFGDDSLCYQKKNTHRVLAKSAENVVENDDV